MNIGVWNHHLIIEHFTHTKQEAPEMTRFLYGSKIFGSNIPNPEPDGFIPMSNAEYEMQHNIEIANLDFVNKPTQSTDLAHIVTEPRGAAFFRPYRSMHPEVYLYYRDTHQIRAQNS